jgi:polyisoprenoid-binding protein YceI
MSNTSSTHPLKVGPGVPILRWQAGPPTSEIRFVLRHPALQEIAGRAGRWTASFVVDATDFTRSSVNVVVDATSLETGVTERNNQARSAGFLNVTAYPTIVFRSREIRAGDGERRFTVAGDLTIRDITRDVTLEVEHRATRGRRAERPEPTLLFTVRTSIHRSDFGLRWHQEVDTGESVAGDEVDLEMEIEARPSLRPRVQRRTARAPYRDGRERDDRRDLPIAASTDVVPRTRH